ncbi:MAG TPA: exodeoxyribonuclease VII large subunit [Mycobacteriales bacterium]|nr:exodeoxyribonuclease VII large subunit [Mycobacteriales bacterium]
MSGAPTPEQPWPVRTVALKINDWVNRLGAVWVEGQVTQLSGGRGNTVFFTLRDPVADVSLNATCSRALATEVEVGARVVVLGRPSFWMARGSLSLAVSEIRQVGLGELLARIERLRVLLLQEGLFDPARKKKLPFLPGSVGLITGRASAAEHDVLENARLRWPAVQFVVENVAVQGHLAVQQCVEALRSLDGRVDVIVIARGGGSVEDLLPFSDEALLRAVAACRTPVVSAIGHEPDNPLLDHVADVRASTPTDAAKRVVPDVREELSRVRQARDRCRRVVIALVDGELRRLETALTRPVFADPHRIVKDRRTAVLAVQDRASRCFAAQLDHAGNDLSHTRARVVALSPQATLDRGYAVLQRPSGDVVRSPSEVADGDGLRVRLATGSLHVTVTKP